MKSFIKGTIDVIHENIARTISKEDMQKLIIEKLEKGVFAGNKEVIEIINSKDFLEVCKFYEFDIDFDKILSIKAYK